MIVFWHSSDKIDDLATYGQIALAFDHVVTPQDDPSIYLSHADLKRPPEPEGLRTYWKDREFWSSQARSAKPHFPHGSFDSAMEHFGYDFAMAQYDVVEAKQIKFEHFLRTAAANDAVILGDTHLADADFENWLASDLAVSPKQRRLDVARALLVLAGIHVALPNIDPDAVDHVLRVKEQYNDEVADYQAMIDELLQGAWGIVESDPTLQDLSTWASHVARTRIRPSLRRLESAIRSGDSKLLAGVGYGMLEQMPDIVGGQLRGSNASLIKAALMGLLDTIAPRLAESMRERKALRSTFGLAYLHRARQAASK